MAEKTYLELFEERLSKVDTLKLLRDCLEECFRHADERREEGCRWQGEGDWYGYNFHQGAASGSQHIELWLREQITLRSKECDIPPPPATSPSKADSTDAGIVSGLERLLASEQCAVIQIEKSEHSGAVKVTTGRVGTPWCDTLALAIAAAVEGEK